MWKNSKISGLVFALLLGLSACNGGGQHLSGQASQQGKNLAVTGETNLPEKALILCSFVDPSKPSDMNRDVITQEFTLVKGGKFETLLKPLTPVPAGKYKLRLRFSPPSPGMASQAEVLAAVGAQGEKLSGAQVVSEGNVRMLEYQTEIEYKP